MLNSLNTQFLYSSNNINNINKFYTNRKLSDEEHSTSVAEPMSTAGGCPVSEIDQYLTHFLQSNVGNIGNPQNQFKTEETNRLTQTDCEDSGFLTSNSSPQLSPMSASSNYSGVETNSSVSHQFEDFNPVSFQGTATPSSWNLTSLENHTSSLAKEIKLFSSYPSKSSVINCELKMVKQPENHHRARYMTEGSRGTIKDRSGRGYPVIQLYGYNKGPVKLQCFIGHDQKIGEPHLFYQACEVSGKTAYRFVKVDGVNMIELEMTPKNNMQITLDCMGILKERNVDVERKVLRSRRKSNTRPVTANEEAKVIRNTNKSRSTHCRMVFRCLLTETGEILQVVSEPILCTQPLGSPEIYKMSIRESDIKGGHELFVIGKNFHKDSKVIFSSVNNWRKVVNPIKEFLNSTHLVCQIPAYDAMDNKCHPVINVEVSVHCNHKTSDPMKFIYTNPSLAFNTKDARPPQLSLTNFAKPWGHPSASLSSMGAPLTLAEKMSLLSGNSKLIDSFISET